MRCRGLVHNGTHSNDGADNRFHDKGDRRDDTNDAATDGRDNGTLKYGKHHENRTPTQVHNLPTIFNVNVDTWDKRLKLTRAEETGVELIRYYRAALIRSPDPSAPV
jgi:hypothetical protein